jgi:hypothetical protein
MGMISRSRGALKFDRIKCLFATKKLDGAIARRALPDEAIYRSEMRLPASGMQRTHA